MERVKLFLIVLLGVTQYSFGYAQADTDSVKTTPKDAFISLGVSYDHRRDMVFNLSVSLTKKPEYPPMKFLFSASYPRTSFGLGWNMYPFPKKRWIGVGVDMIYFYKTNWNIYSELFFGGNGANTFASESGSQWSTQRFVFAPSLELRRIVSWKKLTLNVRANPLIFGFWDFTPGQGWGKWKRWYNVSVGVSYRFTLNEIQNFDYWLWGFYYPWAMVG
jgi:hypothetical protein